MYKSRFKIFYDPSFKLLIPACSLIININTFSDHPPFYPFHQYVFWIINHAHDKNSIPPFTLDLGFQKTYQGFATRRPWIEWWRWEQSSRDWSRQRSRWTFARRRPWGWQSLPRSTLCGPCWKCEVPGTVQRVACENCLRYSWMMFGFPKLNLSWLCSM